MDSSAWSGQERDTPEGEGTRDGQCDHSNAWRCEKARILTRPFRRTDGALIREVGLEKGQIGRIEVREMHSLVEVAPAVADQAVPRLGGVSIRGRRVTARVDRAG